MATTSAARIEEDRDGHRTGSRGSRAGLTLVAVCVAPFVTQLATFALSPFLPFVAADLGTTVAVLGQIPALAFFAAAVLGLVVGPLADRLGHRRTLLAGVAASSVGAILTAPAPSLLILVPVALVGAGGRSIGLPVAQAVVGTRYAGAALRRGLGLIQATGTLAPIVGIPLVTAIGAVAGWRSAFLALGLLGGVAIVLMLWLLPPDGPESRANGPDDEAERRGGPASRTDGTAARAGRRGAGRLSLKAFAPIFADRPTLWLYGSSIARNLGVWAFVTYLGAYLVEMHALSAAEVGWAFTATGLGNFAGSVATGGPLGRIGLRVLAVAAPLVIAVSLAAVVMAPLGMVAVLVLLAVGFVGNGVSIVAHNTLMVGGSPAGRATTTSLNQTCMSLGGAVGGSVGGLLLATGGFPALGALTLVCNLAAAACVLPARRAA
jgi:predicted MFS family arabinose efflux permease